jgi:hypothetical protein
MVVFGHIDIGHIVWLKRVFFFFFFFFSSSFGSACGVDFLEDSGPSRHGRELNPEQLLVLQGMHVHCCTTDASWMSVGPRCVRGQLEHRNIKKSSKAGNWTRVSCVTGRNTDHYTTSERCAERVVRKNSGPGRIISCLAWSRDRFRSGPGFVLLKFGSTQQQWIDWPRQKKECNTHWSWTRKRHTPISASIRVLSFPKPGWHPLGRTVKDRSGRSSKGSRIHFEVVLQGAKMWQKQTSTCFFCFYMVCTWLAIHDKLQIVFVKVVTTFQAFFSTACSPRQRRRSDANLCLLALGGQLPGMTLR